MIHVVGLAVVSWGEACSMLVRFMVEAACEDVAVLRFMFEAAACVGGLPVRMVRCCDSCSRLVRFMVSYQKGMIPWGLWG